MDDFVAHGLKDLVEQFRGKPNIEALVEVIYEQFQEVFDFYEQLRTERDVAHAVGKQLDGVGNIVDLSRMGAALLTGHEIDYSVLDDERYRQFLILKILKNTTHTTYPDIIKAFRMFWDRPLYYTEDPEQPATMIFDTGEMDGSVDTSPLFGIPYIRAAGVTLKLYARTVTVIPPTVVTIHSGMMRVTEDYLPWLDRNIDFDTSVRIVTGLSRVTEDTIPWLERDIDFDAELRTGGCGHTIMETVIGDVVKT